MAVVITRPFTNTGGTPDEYVDNISVVRKLTKPARTFRANRGGSHG